jgi:hypothetical protein
VHFHMPNVVAANFKLKAGDDAANVMWMSLDKPSIDSPHKALLGLAVAKWRKQQHQSNLTASI